MQRFICLCLAIIFSVFISSTWAMTDPDDQNLNRLMGALLERDFDKKANSISALAKTGDQRVVWILTSLLDGDLYYRKKDKRIVYATQIDKSYEIEDVLTNEKLETIGKRKIKDLDQSLLFLKKIFKNQYLISLKLILFLENQYLLKNQ